ncbi:MAG: peptidoglycan editing factor PgeF [Pseudomonadota bacterium]
MIEPPRRTSDIIRAPHGFFGRAGGVSEAPLEGLNASLASGDNQARVIENRARVAHALNADHLLTAKQTHGAQAVFVSEPFAFEDRPEADGLVTDRPGLALGALAADCTPVLLEAPGLVAALHAGWKGSLAGIIEGTVAMMEAHGANRSDIRAAVGPCLRRDSFEVREDLLDSVCSKHPEADRHLTKRDEEHWLYDHAAFVHDRLIAAGLQPDHIDDTGGDTLTAEEDYFSYRGARRAGLQQFGHNVSAIALPR